MSLILQSAHVQYSILNKQYQNTIFLLHWDFFFFAQIQSLLRVSQQGTCQEMNGLETD